MTNDRGDVDAGSERLGLRVWRSTFRFLLGSALVLFVVSGDLGYWQAWTFLALNFASSALANLYLLYGDRELCRRRLLLEEQGEKDPAQKAFLRRLLGVGLGLLALAALDHRFAWSEVSSLVFGLAVALFSAGSWLVLWVFRANTFAASTVEVVAGQTVVASGPYRLVRHPMYTSILAMNVAVPLILGSYWAELMVPLLVWLFIVRLRAEERLLALELPGYVEYVRETPRRLVPGLW